MSDNINVVQLLNLDETKEVHSDEDKAYYLRLKNFKLSKENQELNSDLEYQKQALDDLHKCYENVIEESVLLERKCKKYFDQIKKNLVFIRELSSKDETKDIYINKINQELKYRNNTIKELCKKIELLEHSKFHRNENLRCRLNSIMRKEKKKYVFYTICTGTIIFLLALMPFYLRL